MAQGISEEEFSKLQEQFLELKTVNYALEDKNKKQAAAVSDLETRLRRATADATRLQTVVDKSRRARDTEQLVAANLSLEKKLIQQEEEFRLQNQTLLQELASYVADNEQLTARLDARDGTQTDSGPAADEVLHLRAEAAALRAELTERSERAETELAELRSKVTTLTELNAQLERAARPVPDSLAVEDADFVEVSSAEVCYKKAASGAHELLQAAETQLQLLQSDLQQSADMRLTLETTRRELELCREEVRRLRDYSASGGEQGELRQKLARKQESYQALQVEMEALRQTLESEINTLKQQRQQEADEARARTQRYQTQLNNGYSVLKMEREQSAAAIQALTQRLQQYEPGAAGDGRVPPSPEKSPVAAPHQPAGETLSEVQARLAETETKLAQAEAGRTETSGVLRETEARLREAEAVGVEKEARLVELGDRLSGVEAGLETAEARLAEVSSARDDADKLAGKRKSLLDEMAAHIDSLSAEHAGRLSSAEEAHQQAQTLAETRQQRIQELQVLVDAAESARAQAEEQLQQEQQQLQQLQGQQQQLQQDHAEQLQTLQQELEQLQQQHRDESQKLSDKHQAELKDLSTQLEISSALLAESRDKVAALRQEVKDSVDEKRIHERKGAAITKDLRRQLAQERRRADRLQQALQEAPLNAAAAATATPAHSASASPPADDAQSVSSWSLMSGENGTASAAGSGGSPVDTETVSLLARITRLQEEKWRVEEKLNHLEENSGALADDLANKSALIQFYCMEGRTPTQPAAAGSRRRESTGKAGAAAEAAVVAPVKKLVEFVKHLSLDEQQREMQRRMQRMLEETLTRNMHLQKDLQAMSEQLQTLKSNASSVSQTTGKSAAVEQNGQ